MQLGHVGLICIYFKYLWRLINQFGRAEDMYFCILLHLRLVTEMCWLLHLPIQQISNSQHVVSAEKWSCMYPITTAHLFSILLTQKSADFLLYFLMQNPFMSYICTMSMFQHLIFSAFCMRRQVQVSFCVFYLFIIFIYFVSGKITELLKVTFWCSSRCYKYKPYTKQSKFYDCMMSPLYDT